VASTWAKIAGTSRAAPSDAPAKREADQRRHRRAIRTTSPSHDANTISPPRTSTTCRSARRSRS